MIDMFYVLVGKRARKFNTLREAVVFFESIEDDASVLSASNYVYQLRRSGVVFRNGGTIEIDGRRFVISDIDDMANTVRITDGVHSMSIGGLS